MFLPCFTNLEQSSRGSGVKSNSWWNPALRFKIIWLVFNLHNKKLLVSTCQFNFLKIVFCHLLKIKKQGRLRQSCCERTLRWISLQFAFPLVVLCLESGMFSGLSFILRLPLLEGGCRTVLYHTMLTELLKLLLQWTLEMVCFTLAVFFLN